MLGIDLEDERPQNDLGKGAIALNADDVLAFAAEVGQVVQSFFVAVNGIGQAAFVPGPACQYLGMVALQDRVQLLGRGRYVSGNLVGIQKEHALVDVGWHFVTHSLGALYWFMHASTPRLSHTSTACAARPMASSTTFRSAGPKRPRT